MERSAASEEERRQRIEWLKCSDNVDYWIETYCFIFNATEQDETGGGDWVRFELWPAQIEVLEMMDLYKQLIALKARQLGLTWLALCRALHRMIFRPAATILTFSQREPEAVEMVDRLKGIYDHLPEWMQAKGVDIDDKKHWKLSNGSSARAFSTTGARGYTASMVIIDEADFIRNLNRVLNAVKPTIDAGGTIVMISTVDKEQPDSIFKKLYKSAKAGLTQWKPVFLPWMARPQRTAEWYANLCAESLATDGTLDNVHQEYPATDAEALAGRSLDKRIPPQWLLNCYVERKPMPLPADAPAIAGLEIYVKPVPRRKYVIGGDTSEGNPNSDPASMTVLDALTGEECAALAGRYEPDTFAGYINQVGAYYNNAPAMIERNNHGHAVILYMEMNPVLFLLVGPDDKTGWLNNSQGRVMLWNEMAATCREHDTILHSEATKDQLESIDGSTLSAPKSRHDDRAYSYALAQAGRAAMLRPQQQHTAPRSREY